ncbi:DUF1616 domain-containing protein [Natrialbaceae archaeon A-gly3]
MATDRSWRLLLSSRLQVPADLVAVGVVTVLVNVAVFAPVVRETPLRVPLGIAFVLFVPGYSLVAALFPEHTPRDSHGPDADPFWERSWRSGIDGLERLTLSVGTSVAVVPLVGYLLTVTPWGVRLAPFAVALTGFTLVVAAVAAVRRVNTPEDDRFRVPYREWLGVVREVHTPETRSDAVLNVLLVASVVLAVGSVGYAVAVHEGGDEFSSVALLAEEDGEQVLEGQPATLEPGETDDVILEVDNHEHRPVGYTVVAVEQDAERDGEDVIVHEQRERDRLNTQLEHGETWTQVLEVDPTLADEVRFAWLVYLDGEVPADPSTENAAYYTTLWVTVEDDEPSLETFVDG